MKRGLVVGEVWATRKAGGLAGRQLKLIVEYPEHGQLTAAQLALAPLVVAVDTLDVRRGQEVLVAYGSAARNVLHPGPANRHELCDAAVAMLVEPAPAPAEDPVPGPEPKPEPKPEPEPELELELEPELELDPELDPNLDPDPEATKPAGLAKRGP